MRQENEVALACLFDTTRECSKGLLGVSEALHTRWCRVRV